MTIRAVRATPGVRAGTRLAIETDLIDIRWSRLSENQSTSRRPAALAVAARDIGFHGPGISRFRCGGDGCRCDRRRTGHGPGCRRADRARRRRPRERERRAPSGVPPILTLASYRRGRAPSRRVLTLSSAPDLGRFTAPRRGCSRESSEIDRLRVPVTRRDPFPTAWGPRAPHCPTALGPLSPRRSLACACNPRRRTLIAPRHRTRVSMSGDSPATDSSCGRGSHRPTSTACASRATMTGLHARLLAPQRELPRARSRGTGRPRDSTRLRFSLRCDATIVCSLLTRPASLRARLLAYGASFHRARIVMAALPVGLAATAGRAGPDTTPRLRRGVLFSAQQPGCRARLHPMGFDRRLLRALSRRARQAGPAGSGLLAGARTASHGIPSCRVIAPARWSDGRVKRETRRRADGRAGSHRGCAPRWVLR